VTAMKAKTPQGARAGSKPANARSNQQKLEDDRMNGVTQTDKCWEPELSELNCAKWSCAPKRGKRAEIRSATGEGLYSA